MAKSHRKSRPCKNDAGQLVADRLIRKQYPSVYRLEHLHMSRHRDKRAAFVLALLLVLVFAFGQARRADADRHEAATPVLNNP